jgi:diguanylate cyclase (GGDEF)-like protein
MTSATFEDLTERFPFKPDQNQDELSHTEIEQRHQIIQGDLNKLGRHVWSLWGFALAVIICLTGAVASLSLSIVSDPDEPFYEFHISQSVRGLVGLVLLFGAYTLYQQVQLRRTRGRLVEQIEVAAREQIRAEEFMKLAMLDPLTGLHNRRYVQERLEVEIGRVHRYGSSLTILTLDLDGLKEINDRHGHLGGDLALKALADRLTRAIRGSDLAVRMGGDEFVVLLPECRLGQVQSILARLSPLEIELRGEKIRFACSAGWTEYRTGEPSVQVLERADHALYAEKRVRKTMPASGRRLPAT